MNFFQFFTRHFHSRFPRKRNDRVQMIWHKQAQPAMPDEYLVVEFHGGEHGIASVCAAQLVFYLAEHS